ncbi:transcriptional regulator, GntR family [Thermobaculum terrenum ATCC BAA-798]|uniref:Transcriptional regulator, GntR family n=1 Tax=Thermobaculum terrenum (strain ATCC BAA-798 / CCMEE 7001 / YNP1) TaxID=525904 RepID=D1CGJ9_THET1|nr:GntR family transcriptional regulator [Thermobaculum terrenum]ACZ42870.1 transcriptional regulator, GntR family [Thermobaculum terrenum ATCC BAA-798]
MEAVLKVPPVGQPRRYRELVYASIKEAILQGQFAPGQPLVEEEIARSLNVSRTPVREALLMLEHDGLIETKYGRGMYVRRLTREDFIDMFTANEVIEPYLARRACLYVTNDQIQQMEKVIQMGEEAASNEDVPTFLRSGREFHALIGEAADNRSLAEVVNRNEEKTDLFLMAYGKCLDRECMFASNREHRLIMQALVRRDPDEAARLVLFHCQSVRHRFSPLFNHEEEG